MSVGHRQLFSCVIVIVLLLGADHALAAESVRQKATVFGTPTANLRAGAGVEHALKLTLKEGDPVTIEILEGEWFLVSAADGQKGYIHRNFLKPVENVAAPAPVAPAPPQKSGDITPAPAAQGSSVAQTVPPTVAKSEKSPPPAATSAPVAVAQVKPTDGKAPSLLQLLEAHESEVKIAALVAGIAFILGWFCGGIYYVRRERKHRWRLRL